MDSFPRVQNVFQSRALRLHWLDRETTSPICSTPEKRRRVIWEYVGWSLCSLWLDVWYACSDEHFLTCWGTSSWLPPMNFRRIDISWVLRSCSGDVGQLGPRQGQGNDLDRDLIQQIQRAFSKGDPEPAGSEPGFIVFNLRFNCLTLAFSGVRLLSGWDSVCNSRPQ